MTCSKNDVVHTKSASVPTKCGVYWCDTYYERSYVYYKCKLCVIKVTRTKRDVMCTKSDMRTKSDIVRTKRVLMRTESDAH